MLHVAVAYVSPMSHDEFKKTSGCMSLYFSAPVGCH